MIGRVAVIGAGVAGLTAARHVSRAGNEVVVFDKARGVGGRTSTRRRDPDAYDHGAQYFTSRGPAFASQVRDWCERGVAGVWNAPVRSLGGGDSERNGETTRYVGLPGMSALGRDLLGDLPVKRQHRIEAIEGEPGDWRLKVEGEGPTAGFDAVIVATPAPQAVPLLAPVAEFAEAAAGVAMHACHAAMLSFAGPVEVDFGGAFVANSPLAWVARNSSKPGRPGGECWVLHSTPEWSAAHLDEPAECVADLLLAALGEAIGGSLPAVGYQTAHRWLLARPVKPLGVPFLWDEGGIGVCGDWLHGDRVEDAFNSGDELGRVMTGA